MIAPVPPSLSAGQPEAGLRIANAEITLAGKSLVRIEASIGPGEILTVMGPSGSGKSTLLAFVAGFLDPAFRASGRVILDGRDLTAVPPERRRLGLLFQDPLLLPHLSVAGNLLLGLHHSLKGRRARRAMVEATLDEVELAGFGNRDPASLSGGQAARVGLMRTLLAHPGALLLDEPFSRLDAALRAQMRDLVFQEARRRALPVLLVTHDASDAQAAGGAVVDLGAPADQPDAGAPSRGAPQL